MALRFFLPVLGGLLALSGATAHAQVHRCVDEQGKVSFSDTLCTGAHAHKVFGVNSSAQPWQSEAPRLARTVQTSARAPAPVDARTAPVSTPPR